MRNKKGYSLIELLGAIVIIGLILLVVIPAVSRLLTTNEVKEYNNYLKIIEVGAKSYANKMQDELGFSSDNGCIEVTLNDLINEEYIKAFNDTSITCNGKVRLNNENGNLETSINITCVDENNKETFKEENIGSETCLAFVPKEEGGLTNQIIKNGVGSGSVSTYDNKQYVRGSNPNNYVWYSGKLWRVVWYTDEAVKLISTDIVTIINRSNSTSNIAYTNSLVDKWLQNIFLPTLKDYDDYLIDTSWDVSPTSSPSFLPGKTEVITRKVGLLNSYDVARMGTFIGSDYKWLLSNYYSTSARVATKSGSGYVKEETYSADTYYAIRPAITMKADTFVLSGDGSRDLPYILEGNSTYIPKGTLLNTRYSGEYLKINNELYKIVKTNNNLTKVIMVNTLDARIYDTVSSNFSYSSLYNYLKNDWYVNDLGTDKELVFENGSWCFDVITSGVEFSESCSSDSVTSPVGIPSLGDVYTANNNGNTDTFWTIDAFSMVNDIRMNVISKDTRITLEISGSAKVKPVMYLKSNVSITSGNGTIDSPFVLELK